MLVRVKRPVWGRTNVQNLVLEPEDLCKVITSKDEIGRALAASAGLHRTYVGLVERGLRNATIDAGTAMAQAVGRTLSQLIREAERRVGP